MSLECSPVTFMYTHEFPGRQRKTVIFPKKNPPRSGGDFLIRLRTVENTAAQEKRNAALRWLSGHAVQAGLPASAPARARFLLAIQEHGSPVMRIPPRPVVRPALSRPDTRAGMAEALREAAAAAHAGDLPKTQAALEACGQLGADGIRAYIDAGIAPGNSPVTVHGGWIYNRPAGKGVYISGKGFDRPLYDTGGLYRAFSWEIVSR